MNLSLSLSLSLSQVLDRLKLCDNAATMLTDAFTKACHNAFTKACRGNVEDFSLSRSSTCRARLVNRLKLSQNIMDEFGENASEFLALHWDGKLIKDRYGNKFKALYVLISEPPTYSKSKLVDV